MATIETLAMATIETLAMATIAEGKSILHLIDHTLEMVGILEQAWCNVL